MPIKYSIDTDLGVIFTAASGVLTDDEVFDHKKNLFSDPNFKPGIVELADIRHISDLTVSADGIRRFVMQDAVNAKVVKDFKLAAVVSEDRAFGMGRMYEAMSSENGPIVRIFRDMDEAKAWLGIPT